MEKGKKAKKEKEEDFNEGITADKPDKTINIDLCFIPAEEMHEIDFFQLLDEFSKKFSDAGENDNKAMSGLDIFSQEEKKYDEKMNDYVLMRKSKQDTAEANKNKNKKSDILAIEENLKQTEEELRTRRRRIRIERKKEDEEWKKYRDERIKLKKNKKNC